ncbi:MAG: OmpH family outer membrane protein [Casimicrobiaceae bacterium]|nr:OmpH family outer membrane protein [Casimicrobiaceae bacterium]MCX8098961.1 OmpH family outer membrane protein [Casimicrobiaceae bacterium]MDW8312469.1 OmpH family outer membrane protein [Burkholderiales bacterium]
MKDRLHSPRSKPSVGLVRRCLRALGAVGTLCAVAAFATHVAAQGGATQRSGEIKIGFVNTEKLLRESAPAQRALKKLEREFAARQAEVEKLAKRFRDASAAFERDQLTMSDTERRNRQRDLDALARELQRAQRELREDENLRRNEELAALQERLQKAIQQIAEAERFDLILQEAVYVSGRIDITDRVLRALADR